MIFWVNRPFKESAVESTGLCHSLNLWRNTWSKRDLWARSCVCIYTRITITGNNVL